MLEIEQKFRIDDPLKTVAIISERFDVIATSVQDQFDWYYSHPTRDFGKTDEALRVRHTIVQGDKGFSQSLLTYKGPRMEVLGDGRKFKTRREIELPIGSTPGDADRIGELLEALGFQSMACVVKIRRCLRAKWGEWDVEFALDDVRGLGTFVEIEIIADENVASAARKAISEIAGHLGLESPITNSYRNMLLGDRTRPI